MRMIVFYDLPMKTNYELKVYARFRRDLYFNGFKMLQYSIYSKICANNDMYTKYLKKVQSFAPKTGNIRILKVTEKQYASMVFIFGTKMNHEKYLTDRRFLIF